MDKSKDDKIQAFKKEPIYFEECIFEKEQKFDQHLAHILIDKHQMKYPLQFMKLSLNVTFERYTDRNYIRETKKLHKVALPNLNEVVFAYIQRKRDSRVKAILEWLPRK